MVGRGWWLQVSTVCVAWTVCCVLGVPFCQKDQEFYDSRDGQCVPCTRCHDPYVVVVPCYIYQDAVCAPAINFLPNLSQHTGAQAPITLSNPSFRNASGKAHSRERQTSSLEDDGHRVLSNSRKNLGPRQGEDKSFFNKKKHRIVSNDTLPHSVSDFEKSKVGHTRHHHRHKHIREHSTRRNFRNKSLVALSPDPEVNGNHVSQRSGANESVFGLLGSGERDSGLTNVNITLGANSNKDLNSDLQETETSHWTNIFFLMTVVIVSVCVIVLIIIIVSHLRNILIRRKLKRVCEAVHTENNSEVTVMAQLLPTAVCSTRSQSTFSNSRTPVMNARCTLSRPSVAAASLPSTPTTTSRERAVAEFQQSTGQMYPPIPFTMDRLLEQRRVLGPSTSVDTNLYIESWQQVDSQLPSQHTPAASPVVATRRTRPFHCGSANPSPVPLRTYRRLAPASASASPVTQVRGLGSSRVSMRGFVGTSASPQTSSNREVVLNSRT